MKIAIVDTLGLCYDGTTLQKRGLGGSESAVILMSKELVRLGFEVTVYNDCTSDDASPGTYDGVVYKPLAMVEDNQTDFDVLIASRSVAPFALPSMRDKFKSFIPLPDFTNLYNRSRHRVLWMHDTFCDGDRLVEYYTKSGRIDEVFVLSDFHNVYVTTCNHGEKRMFEVLKRHMFITRNGIVRYHEEVDIAAKDPNLYVYNASVTKGLRPLIHKIWPRIKAELPDAKLTVIGGYYRFRDGHEPDAQEIELMQLVEQYPDVNFTGVIKQSEIADILAKASYMIYPCDFPETFGISALEALAYNTPLITCDFGAMEETAIDSACYKIPYSVTPSNVYPHINETRQVDLFVNETLAASTVPYIHQQKMNACNAVKDICGWDTVALQWKQHLYRKLGAHMPLEEYRAVKDINYNVRKVFGRRFINPEENITPIVAEQPIHVIVPVFNGEKYIDKCIHSLAAQDYNNYRVHIIDDASTDNTRAVVTDTLSMYDDIIANRFVLYGRDENVGAVKNQWDAISNCSGGIIMLVDGDDWLTNDPTIFHQYNYLYAQGAEFTYGSCHSLADNIDLIAQPYPRSVRDTKSYRQHKFAWNMPYTHLRTFTKQLFDRVSIDDILVNGQWPKAGGDGSLFYSLIEAADPDRIVAVTDVNYVYNDLNPINDYKVNGDEQTETANAILEKGKKMNKFSVVIPTMWKYQPFSTFLDRLLECEHVGEVILINNAPSDTPSNLGHPKLRHVTYGYNIGVNPAWNIGIGMASFENVCVVNDDINFDLSVFEDVAHRLLSDSTGVIGISPGIPEYGQIPITDGKFVIAPWTGQHTFGFGQLMFIRKDKWNNIPDDLVYFYGDYYVFDYQLSRQRTNYVITNLFHHTEYAQTCTKIGLDIEATKAKEEAAYQVILSQMQSIKDVDPNRTPEPKKILIAIPTNKYIESLTFKSIYDLIVPQGYTTEFQFFYGYQIDQIRNLIAEWGKQYDYLFCVDSDIVLPNDTLVKLLAADKDIVSGVYRQRFDDKHVVEVYKVTQEGGFANIDWTDLKSEGVVEVGACGFGCVLIKNEVLVGIEYPHFIYKSALDHKYTFSEDVFFCKKARECGFTVWCDTSIVCGHIGTHNFAVD